MTDGLWDLAYDAGWDDTYEDAKPAFEGPGPFAWHFAQGAEWGAGWMYALIAMGQAIHDNHLCMSCINVHSADDDGLCQRCGHRHGHWPLEDD